MSEQIMNINEVVELQTQELDAIAGGNNVPVPTTADAVDDVKLVAQSPTDSGISSLNQIYAAFHLIAWNI